MNRTLRLTLAALPLLAAPTFARADDRFAAPPNAHGTAVAQLEAQMQASRHVAATYETAAVGKAGKIAGLVKLAGSPPAPQPTAHTKDAKVCGESSPDETLEVGPKGGLAGAVVTLEITGGKKLEPGAATLDQKGCRYAPHVQAVALGSKLTVTNSDPLLHNVHAYKDDAGDWNVAQFIQGQKNELTLAKPGLFHVRCDVHGWMSSWLYVADNPYFAVTDASGAFTIADVPPGTYTATIWHERTAPETRKVTVPASGTAKLEVSLAVKPQ